MCEMFHRVLNKNIEAGCWYLCSD